MAESDLIDVERLGLPVLRQTRDDVVVLKPAGMATELTTDPRRVSLVSRVRAACRDGVQVRLVHRLDRVTRGVVMVALSREAAAFYGEQIREGVWEKYYLARIPKPRPESDERHRELIGVHRAYLREEEGRARLVRSGGKTSLLEILAVEGAPGRVDQCHVLIRLMTGRLHQIRVMLSGLGLPLVGDELYGGDASEGPVYLEHTALWYVEATSREVMLAHLKEDAEREALSGAMRRALERVVGSGRRG